MSRNKYTSSNYNHLTLTLPWPWGIHFALVDTRYGGERRTTPSSGRRGLPTNAPGIRRVVSHGRRVYCLSRTTSMAHWVYLSGLRRKSGLANSKETDVLRVVSSSDIRYGGNDFRRDTKAAPYLVPGDVVCNEPKIRWKRARSPACCRVWKLPDSMDLAPQDATCHDSSRERSPQRRSGSR